MKFIVKGLLMLLMTSYARSQSEEPSDRQLDSTYIDKVQNILEPDKVLHAEPLYIDLIRDLGARNGEAEWNAALELTDRLNYDRYLLLVEYEWAAIDRLGLEIEIPATLYSSNIGSNQERPSNRVESIKTALQWTFLVNQSAALSMALGYINELEFADLNSMSNGPVFVGNIFNPFLVVAKRWGQNFHTLLYTGPRTIVHFNDGTASTRLDVNFSMHYMLTGTRNFIGIESNSILAGDRFASTLRPQMRLGITDHTLIGLGVSIPVSRENDRLGMFVRMIWEPE